MFFFLRKVINIFKKLIYNILIKTFRWVNVIFNLLNVVC